MSANAQTDRQQGRNTHHSPPCYSPPLIARSGPKPLGGYRHPSHFGRQTGGSPCSLHFAFSPTDRSGTDPLFGKGFDGFDAWRPHRQTRGMELEAE